jgi:hypothetical protein
MWRHQRGCALAAYNRDRHHHHVGVATSAATWHRQRSIIGGMALASWRIK